MKINRLISQKFFFEKVNLQNRYANIEQQY